MTPRLSKGAAKAIDSRLDDLFDMLKIKLLGPQSVGRRLYVGFTHELSIPGIFERAVSEEGGKLDTTLLDHLIEITSDFIDKTRAEAKAASKKKIQDIITDLDSGKLSHKAFESRLEEDLGDIWASVTANVARVVDTQTQQAQTLGIKSGIDQINTNLGVEDPVVCFIPVKDQLLCDECKRLHLLEDLNTPRVWLSSEVKAGYHKKGDPEPSWSLLHPHCRCALTTVLPGFGFVNGRIAWIGEGHDEWAHQRGEKSRFIKNDTEMYGEFLAKSTRHGMSTFRAHKLRWHRNGTSHTHEPFVPGEQWLTPTSVRYGPEHAIYWALTSPEFAKYYEGLTPDKQSHLRDIIPNYGSRPQQFFVPKPADWYPDPETREALKKLEGYKWATAEEATQALKDAGVNVDSMGYWNRPYFTEYGDPVPSPVNGEVESILDEITPGWREFDAKQHKLDPKVAKLFAKGKIKVNIPANSLKKVTQTGRWKNLYETGEGKGDTNQESRLSYEANLGLPEDLNEIPATKRPVYGWYDFIEPLKGKDKDSMQGVNQYGDVVVHLKDSVKKRSTLTPTDSSGVEHHQVFLHNKEGYQALLNEMVGSRAKHWNGLLAGHRMLDEDVLSDLGVGYRHVSIRVMEPDHNYVEAQIHGGIYPRTDVESVHATNARALETATEFGKKFKVPVYDKNDNLTWHPSMESTPIEDQKEGTEIKELSKSFKGAVAGAAMGLAAMAPGKVSNPPMERPAPIVTTQEHPFNRMGVPELDKHLKAISFLETSGGKFQNHAKDPRGDYWTAFGPLGFKPAVAHEFYNKHKGLQQSFPGLKDPKVFTNAFKTYPALYNSLANTYWHDMLSKVKEPGLAAFKWRNGKYADSRDWRKHEYVRRFTDLFIPEHERLADTGVPWLDDLKLSEQDKTWLESSREPGVKLLSELNGTL